MVPIGVLMYILSVV